MRAIKEFRIVRSSHFIPHPHNGPRDAQGAAQTPNVEVVELNLVLSEGLWDSSPCCYMLPAGISGRTRGKGHCGEEGSQDPRLQDTRIQAEGYQERRRF